MVKTDYKDLRRVPPSSDAALRSSSTSSDLVDSSRNGMEPRRLNVAPGSGRSSGGNRGRSVGNTSSRHRGRMSDPPSGSRIMPLSNVAAAAAVDGGGSGSWSTEALELALDEWRRRIIWLHSLPEAPQILYQVARLLFPSSPMRLPPADDNVLIVDGVLVGNSESRTASSTRRYVSFSDPGLVTAGSPGSGDGGRFGFNYQVTSPNSGRFSIGSPNMQGSPVTPRRLFPPGYPFPTAISSYIDATVSIRPPASYFTPSPWTPQQPQTKPGAAAPFAWPPTVEEDASIAEQLYGPSTGARRRLPVFQAICPAEAE